MTKVLKFSGFALMIAAFAFCAMVAAGLLFAVATNPAHAGAARVTASPPNPVTPEMQQGLTRDFNAFMVCLGSRTFDAREKDPAVVRLEAANNAAGWAAANRDLAAWNAEAAKVRAELPALKVKYGC